MESIFIFLIPYLFNFRIRRELCDPKVPNGDPDDVPLLGEICKTVSTVNCGTTVLQSKACKERD